MERVTVHKHQLVKSRTLNDAGFYVLIVPEYPDEEQIFLGLCSEPKASEKEALDQLSVIELIYAQGMKGDKVYVIDGEVKIWHEGEVFVAYEQICFPGVNSERALELKASIFDQMPP
jgi:hypothetical protein